MYRSCVLLLTAISIDAGVIAQEPALTLDEAFDAVRTYELGHDAAPLQFLVEQVMATYGDAAARRDLANRFAALLSSDATFDGKLFACRQLYIIGTDEQLPAIAPLLLDEKLSDAARYALEAMPGDAVDQALLDAMSRTSGKVKIGIINSLRVRRCATATQPLAACLRESDIEVAKAAALALGAIGATDAARELMLVMIEEVPGLHRTIVDAYLAVAWAELAAGHVDSAREMFRAVHHAPEAKAQLMAAAAGWIEADPRSAARLLLIMLTEKDFEWVLQAVQYVRTIPGKQASQYFVDIIENEPLPPENEALLIKALADRGDRLVLPAITKALDSEHEAVRAAAVEGLGILGDATSVPGLTRVAATTRGEEQRAARKSLYRLSGDAVDAAILDEMSRSEPQVRVELIRAIGERGTAGALDLLIAQVGDVNPEVQEAAGKALASVAAYGDLPKIVDVLLSCPEQARSTLARSMVQVARKAAVLEGAAAPVIEGLGAAQDPRLKATLLQALGEIGDPSSLDVLRAGVKDSNEELAYAAVSALSDWPDAAPLQDLLSIAENAPVERSRSRALDGYVRMLRLPGNRPASETATLYEHALKLATTASTKRHILSGLSELADAKALDIVEQYLTDVEVKAEAAVAAERIRSSFYQVSASSNTETARQALDKNVDTRWTSGKPQSGDEWFLVDMVRTAEIAGILLDTSRSLKDYPRGYEVYAYVDESNPGAPVAKGEGSGPVLEIRFAPVSARFLKIVQTGRVDDGWWWSIDELRVLAK